MVLSVVSYGTITAGYDAMVGNCNVNHGLWYCHYWVMALSMMDYGTTTIGLWSCQWWAIVLSVTNYATVSSEPSSTAATSC